MKKINFILLALIFICNSCEDNDEINNLESSKSIATRMYLNALVGSLGSINVNSNASNSLGFSLVFPVKVTYSNGAVVTINSINGLKEAIYSETATMHIQNIHFPFSLLTYPNNNHTIIASEHEFLSVLIGVNSVLTVNEYFSSSNCFEFIFPLSVINNNGEMIAIPNVNSLQNLLNAMPENEFWVDFIYPFQIKYNNATTRINNAYDFYSNVDCIPSSWFCNLDFNPTCIQTFNGIIQFDNPCWAIKAGYSENDFVTCD